MYSRRFSMKAKVSQLYIYNTHPRTTSRRPLSVHIWDHRSPGLSRPDAVAQIYAVPYASPPAVPAA